MADRSKFEINGKIDTSQSVLSNIEQLANASGCFITWDPNQGRYSVIVNEPSTPVAIFEDNNILGPISVGGTGVSDLYNSVQVEFPHKDLRDATDYITLTIPSADRNPQEVDNQLTISLPHVNNPVQAQLIGNQELKQARVDTIITFRADFTANEVKAGDLINVTNSQYGYANKIFRVIQIEEEDTDEGGLVFNITALEYDANVYSTAGLEYDLRTKITGIQSKITNEVLEAEDDIDAGASIGRLLVANAAAGLFNSLLQGLFGNRTADGNLTEEEATAAEEASALLSGAKKPPLTHSASVTEICEGGSVTITLTDDCETCFFTVPDYDYEYEITGIQEADIDIPLTGTVSITGGTGSITFNTTVDGDAYETLTFTCGENSTDVVIQSPQAYSYESISASPSSITEGDTTTITITSSGIADGTTKPYTISGTASGKVTSPALTGIVTFNSNQATLTVVTNNDSVYTGGQSLDIEIEPGFSNPCAVNDERTISVSVADDESAPPADVSCDYQSVPIVWCGTWDGTTGYLKSVSAQASANLPIVSSGGTAVPSAISVTNANTASAAISIDSTVNVDTSVAAGMNIDVITSFSAPGSGPYLPGTTTTVKGY